MMGFSFGGREVRVTRVPAMQQWTRVCILWCSSCSWPRLARRLRRRESNSWLERERGGEGKRGGRRKVGGKEDRRREGEKKKRGGRKKGGGEGEEEGGGESRVSYRILNWEGKQDGSRMIVACVSMCGY